MTQDEFEAICADLAEAIRHHNAQVMTDIIRQCPRVLAEQPFGQHPLHWAAAANNCVAIEAFLALGISPDVHSEDSFNTPLCSAAVFGHLEAGKLLLSSGATVSPAQLDVHFASP